MEHKTDGTPCECNPRVVKVPPALSVKIPEAEAVDLNLKGEKLSDTMEIIVGAKEYLEAKGILLFSNK